MVAIENNIYIFGGYGDGGSLNDFYKIDTKILTKQCKCRSIKKYYWYYWQEIIIQWSQLERTYIYLVVLK